MLNRLPNRPANRLPNGPAGRRRRPAPAPAQTGRRALLALPAAALFLAAPLFSQSVEGQPAEGQSAADLLAEMRYRPVGPSRGGRVTAVAGHRSQPGTFYLGATGGGVWKTTDYGHHWHPISDGTFASPSIGAVAVAESDRDIVYVTTGSDGLRSNVIIGKGAYRSDDAGKTWRAIGLEDTGNTGAVLIHPEDPDRAFVAAIGNPFAPNPERGVYRTTDGGASWELVLHLSERTGATDLEFHPEDPDTIYASMWEAERKPWTIRSGGMEGGVHRSTDGGNTWEPLENGLPTGLRGKSDLAVSPAAPDRVYVLIEAPDSDGGVYRSDDRGDSWRQVSDFQPIRNRPFYYTNLHAHPTDADTLWGMAEGYFKSEDGGETWERKFTPHGDNHDLWINPDHPQIQIQANDGGANVTLDGGETWSTQENQPTAELYQVDVSDDFPYRLYAGQQDNSTISVPSYPPHFRPGGHTAHWEAIGGCETGPVVPKPGDPDLVYANCKGRFGLYNARTGQEEQYYVGFWNIYGHNPKDLEYRFQRTVPIHVSPHDPARVYHASQYVHVTEDGGRTWRTISPDLTAFTPETQVVSGDPITLDVTGEEHFAVLYDVQESPHENGVIWAGANDGPIHVTKDGGRTWKEVTPPGIGPYGRVQNIEVSPHDPAKAYAAILRYQLGDFTPHAYRTTDYGETWTRLTDGTNGVPNDHPVRVVREDPAREGLLYLGTEWGMFVSFDDGATWASFQQNLPVTPVTDLKVVGSDLALSTMGRGFWILDDVSPLHERAAADAPHLFAPRDEVRFRFAGRPFGAGSPADPVYPTPGPRFTYRLPGAVADASLEIHDADGALLRRFESGGEGMAEERTQGMRAPGRARRGQPTVPTAAGVHRFSWDMRHEGPKDGEGNPGGRGPLAAPGRYTVTLTAGDFTASRDFRLLLDPRVAKEGWVTGEQVREQVALALRARDALSEANAAAARLDAALGSGGGPEELRTIHEELVTPPVRYSQPMLVDQLRYLYSNLDSADQPPGADARQRYAELRAQLDGLLARLAAAGVAAE